MFSANPSLKTNMHKMTHVWSRANDFVRTHFLILLIILGAGWWLLDGNDPVMFSSKTSTNYAMDDGMDMEESYMMADSMAAPMMARTQSKAMGFRGGIIEPPVAHAEFVPDVTDRKIVKNGSLQLEVPDTEAARERAEARIQAAGGAVTHMNSWEVRPGVLAYNLTTRIPSDKLEDTIDSLTELGVKKSENFNTTDITAQYRDTIH